MTLVTFVWCVLILMLACFLPLTTAIAMVGLVVLIVGDVIANILKGRP